MIAFLTLLYVGVLFIMLKIGIIKMTLWWKLSPVVLNLVLFVVLFLPMQWGAPSGTVNVYQSVVEIVPNVTGTVIEVPVKPLSPLKKGDVLFKLEPRPFQAKVDQLEASLKLIHLNLGRAKHLLNKKVASQLDVDKYTAEADKLIAQLDSAKYDLESTTVKAPGDGYVIGLTLRAGQRIGSLPARSFMSFVKIEKNRVVIGIHQNSLRHIQVGHKAEVTFKLKLGKVFNAEVEDIALITPDGQLAPSGNITLAPTAQNMPQPYGVVLKIDDDAFKDIEMLALNNIKAFPGGAFGTGTVYTESVQATHLIRKVMLRMDAWMNYIMPI
ncbi:MAG: HlyD family secretion protein [Methyloprofundus sp.]|nr:HlyD family secretion protein [Methyloprofundus sp.]